MVLWCRVVLTLVLHWRSYMRIFLRSRLVHQSSRDRYFHCHRRWHECCWWIGHFCLQYKHHKHHATSLISSDVNISGSARFVAILCDIRIISCMFLCYSTWAGTIHYCNDVSWGIQTLSVKNQWICQRCTFTSLKMKFGTGFLCFDRYLCASKMKQIRQYWSFWKVMWFWGWMDRSLGAPRRSLFLKLTALMRELWHTLLTLTGLSLGQSIHSHLCSILFNAFRLEQLSLQKWMPYTGISS